MSCAICQKRPPKRFCPAKGEKICAICCGEEREVTIDCPADCSYLIAAHRYEAEHRKPIPPGEFPYRDVQFPVDFVYERWPVVAGVGSAIHQFQIHNKDLSDGEVLSVLEALAETYRTLGSGIYFERPPDARLARALYGQIAELLEAVKKEESSRVGFSTLKDSEIFQLLVFLLRVGKQETNGRLRSRAFLGFIRARFPLPAEVSQETSRIVMP
jgi:hypothetical protein